MAKNFFDIGLSDFDRLAELFRSQKLWHLNRILTHSGPDIEQAIRLGRVEKVNNGKSSNDNKRSVIHLCQKTMTKAIKCRQTVGESQGARVVVERKSCNSMTKFNSASIYHFLCKNVQDITCNNIISTKRTLQKIFVFGLYFPLVVPSPGADQGLTKWRAKTEDEAPEGLWRVLLEKLFTARQIGGAGSGVSASLGARLLSIIQHVPLLPSSMIASHRSA